MDYSSLNRLKDVFKQYIQDDVANLASSIKNGQFRQNLNLNELRSKNKDLVDSIIRSPRDHMIAYQQALLESLKDNDSTIEKELNNREIQVGFEGLLGANSVTPRGLDSHFLNTLVEVEGIVVKCSSVRPKIEQSVQYCSETDGYHFRQFRDNTSLDLGIQLREGGKDNLPTGAFLPTEIEGKELEVEYGLCNYKDFQTLVIQEMPEKSRVGQLPRSIDVILENDLVDRVKPGDRVVCVGVYRALPSQEDIKTTGVFRTVLICNNISVIGKEIGAVKLSAGDIQNIRQISEENDLLDLMAKSLCPSIYGHHFIKKALILQLLGGTERVLENGTHLRGDINIMLVGDPSTAKSQLLRSIMDIAPLSISTTGKGSSGVGLTAAVTFDSLTKEKRLEAGAMVLADRGIVCIDEFDKMQEADRVAIHEVMEQQTVTIAKAGIHATLNARCSVIAAANPIYGHYNRNKSIIENVSLPDSLLSRFDLLFVVLDSLDPHLDRRLAEHVLNSHMYRKPGTIMEPEPLNATTSINLDDNSQNNSLILSDSPVWLRGKKNDENSSSSNNDILTKEFLRKYLHYAKNRINPVLTEEANARIAQAYVSFRSQSTQKKNLPITARTLETIIRIATSSAKLRLSNLVELEDAEIAIELLNFVLFHEVGNYHTAAGTATNNNDTNTNTNIPSGSTTVRESPIDPMFTQDSKKRKTLDDEDTNEIISSNNEATDLNEITSVNESDPVYEKITMFFANSLDDIVPIEDIKAYIRSVYNNVSDRKIMLVLESLQNKNRIMIDDEYISIV